MKAYEGEIVDRETYETVHKAVMSWISMKSGRSSKIDIASFAEDLIQTALLQFLRYGETCSPGAISKKTGLMNKGYLYKSSINVMKNVYKSSYFNSVSTVKIESSDDTDASVLIALNRSHVSHDDFIYNEIREEYRGDSRMKIIIEAIEEMEDRDTTIGDMMIKGFSDSEICEEVGLVKFNDFYKRLKRKVQSIIDQGDTKLAL